MTKKTRIALAGFVVGLFLAWPPLAAAPGTATNRVVYGTQSDNMLVMGVVTRAFRYNYGRLQGIAEYMLRHVADFGITGIEVVTVNESDTMRDLLAAGSVDWLSATPFDAVSFVDQAGAELLLAKEQRGRSSYRSVFFARKDSDIDSLDDLVGKRLAFEKPTSTSAYLIPSAILREAGIRLVRLDGIKAEPPEDAVGYLFTGDESNISAWVHKNIVAAGAFSDRDWRSEWNNPEKLREDMQIFHTSEDIPRSMEIVRGDLPLPLKARIREVLLRAPDDPKAETALRDYYMTTGFREIDDADRRALDNIRRQARLLSDTPVP